MKREWRNNGTAGVKTGMDTWLKTLIAGTCVMLICGVLCFVIGDWRSGPSETDLVLKRHEDVMRRIRDAGYLDQRQ